MPGDWGVISALLSEKLNIPIRILNLVAVYDILKLTASGVSKLEISLVTEQPISYVEDASFNYLGTIGWDTDIDFNPYQVFMNNLTHGYADFETFKSEVHTISPITTDDEITALFFVAKQFKHIDDEIESEWE
jgi:hypothetical protein